MAFLVRLVVQAGISGRKLETECYGRRVEAGFSGRKVKASLYNLDMSRFGQREKRRILAAMAEIECSTCVQFRPRAQEASYVY